MSSKFLKRHLITNHIHLTKENADFLKQPLEFKTEWRLFFSRKPNLFKSLKIEVLNNKIHCLEEKESNIIGDIFLVNKIKFSGKIFKVSFLKNMSFY